MNTEWSTVTVNTDAAIKALTEALRAIAAAINDYFARIDQAKKNRALLARHRSRRKP